MQNNLHCWITMPFTLCQVSILVRRHINNVVVPSMTALSPGDLKERPTCVPPAVAMSKLNHGEVFGCGSFMSGHNRSQSWETREVVPESRIKADGCRRMLTKPVYWAGRTRSLAVMGPNHSCSVTSGLIWVCSWWRCSVDTVRLAGYRSHLCERSEINSWTESSQSRPSSWSDENNLTSARGYLLLAALAKDEGEDCRSEHRRRGCSPMDPGLGRY